MLGWTVINSAWEKTLCSDSENSECICVYMCACMKMCACHGMHLNSAFTCCMIGTAPEFPVPAAVAVPVPVLSLQLPLILPLAHASRALMRVSVSSPVALVVILFERQDVSKCTSSALQLCLFLAAWEYDR